MSPSVRKSSRILVCPQGKTPSCNLQLSSIDKLPVFQRGVDLIQVFTHAVRPAMAIKEALSLALNHYYPLAGRQVLSPEGELEIFCTGDGVWFVEAFADCTLEDVNFLELPLMITDDEILPYPRPGAEQKDAAIVLIQVTEFRCGGFTVVCAMNHAVLDGSGLIQFLNSIGEIARGIDKLSVTPIWSRDSIPLPVKIPTLRQLDLSIAKSSTYDSSTIIDVSEDTINQL